MTFVTHLLATVALTAATEQPRPTIYYVTPNTPSEGVVLVLTDGLGQGKVKAVAYAPKPGPDVASAGKTIVVPDQPPKGSRRGHVLSRRDGALAVALPRIGSTRHTPTAVLWVGTGKTWSRPFVINQPKAWFVRPREATPGAVLRIVGVNLHGHREPTAWLVDPKAGREVKLLAVRRYNCAQPPYELNVRVPADCAPGQYRLRVHNGSGGDFGWSTELKLTVAPAPQAPAFRVVRPEGVAADGLTSDSAAIQAALNQVGQAGGGTVVLPTGVLRLSAPLAVPARVTLRGSGQANTTLVVDDRVPFEAKRDALGKHLTAATRFPFDNYRPMVIGTSHFTVEDLTLRARGFQVGTPLVSAGPESTRDVTARHVTFDYWYPAQGIDGKLLPNWVGGFIAGRISDLEITHCTFKGRARLWIGHMVHSWIAHNTLDVRSLFPLVLKGTENSIIEHNTTRRAARGLVMSNTSPWVHNLVAFNCVEETTLGTNAGETYLMEGFPRKTDWLGRGVGAGDRVRVERTPWKPDQHVGSVCLVVSGRGIGQYRCVLRNTTNEAVLERPWTVEPDATSLVSFSHIFLENAFYANTQRRGDAALQPWGNAVANIFDRHMAQDSQGIILIGMYDIVPHRQRPNYRGGNKVMFRPAYLNQIVGARLRGRDTIDLVCRVPHNDQGTPAIPMLGNVVSRNEVVRPLELASNQPDAYWLRPRPITTGQRSRAIALRSYCWGRGTPTDMTPRQVMTILDGNRLMEAAVGVTIDRFAAQTVLHRNVFDRIQTPVVDKGVGTVGAPAPKGATP